MILPKPIPEPPSPPLPLFRPEAIEAQRQKFYGEILLIRPLSLSLLIWLAIGISAAILAYLALGTYTERTRITGVLLAGETAKRQADFYVPSRAIGFVHPGESVQAYCQSCPQAIRGTITDISKSVLSSNELPQPLNSPVQGPMYRVTLTLPQGAALPSAEGTSMEAELPLGRRPLLQWLFERGDSGGGGK
jgi:HlyD family secretion protein